MTSPKTSRRGGFSIFPTAAEEAETKREERSWENEGGHMSCTAGRIVFGGGSDKQFKVIMSRDGGKESEHVFETMQEAEAFVRRNTPRPPVRSTTYDQEGGGG
jgi:hypothetical protein